jgi:hypothetical protein
MNRRKRALASLRAQAKGGNRQAAAALNRRIGPAAAKKFRAGGS